MPSPVPTKPKRPCGRPTKLTGETRAQVLADIERGHQLQQAATRAGVHRVTLYRWARDNRAKNEAARWFPADVAHARVSGLRKLSGPVLEDRGGALVLVITRLYGDGVLAVDERAVLPGSRSAERLMRRRDLAAIAERSGMPVADIGARLALVPSQARDVA